MTTLNLVLDEMLDPVPTEVAAYTADLAHALIEYAPPECFVEGIVASSPESSYLQIDERLPGLRGLFKSALTRRDLAAAWQHGFTPVPTGMIHAPSLFAPLRSHDRVHTRGNQIAVTIHDVAAWSHPEGLPSRQVSWAKAMGLRALKYADAVVVPTHAVATALGEYLPFGDRIRVINVAVRTTLQVPDDADDRARRLELPGRYLIARADGTAAAGLPALFAALALRKTTVALVLVGDDDATAELIAGSGLSAGRVKTLGSLDDADLATTLARADAFIAASPTDGTGVPLLEAFSLGVPVIHIDSAALVEVAGDAGLTVPAADADALPGELLDGIERVLDDEELRRTLAVQGSDRERFFSWRGAADGVWQLHADL